MNIKNQLKNFYLFQCGQAVSQLGSKITSYGLILWTYDNSKSVLSIALLTICTLMPSILLSFLAGSISDKWNKKKIMIISDSIAAFFSLIVLILLITNSLKIEYIYIINFILGVVDAFQNPASEVAISLIISKENYIRVSGIRSLCNSCITIFYPILATTIYAFAGLKLIIFIDLITFIFAVLTLIFLVNIPKKIYNTVDNTNILQQCKIGIRYIVNDKGILSLILFMAFVNLIAAIYNCNLQPMILSRNGNNKFQLGIVTATIGIAGVVGSILVTIKKESKKKVSVILNIMMFSFAICNTLLGIGRNCYIWTIAVFLGNVVVPFLTANVEYNMRNRIPLEMQGVVFSARNTLQYISIPIGYLLGGILADKVFEPNVYKISFLTNIVGSEKGAGIALIYIVIGIIGSLGCCIFKLNNDMKNLDN